ncbi:MAG: hypothetical protein AVDCRST_MAG67-2066, partial [uncultured Solirubrobacteraceae bacterium]
GAPAAGARPERPRAPPRALRRRRPRARVSPQVAAPPHGVRAAVAVDDRDVARPRPVGPARPPTSVLRGGGEGRRRRDRDRALRAGRRAGRDRQGDQAAVPWRQAEGRGVRPATAHGRRGRGGVSVL